MHELSIADNIISAVQKAANLRSMRQVSKIGVRIGSLSSVDPEALTFGFDVLKKEKGIPLCELSIESVSTRAKCRKCSLEFTVEDLVFVCSRCSSSQCDLINGQELEIVYFEGE